MLRLPSSANLADAAIDPGVPVIKANGLGKHSEFFGVPWYIVALLTVSVAGLGLSAYSVLKEK
jgi:hypothetical protein